MSSATTDPTAVPSPSVLYGPLPSVPSLEELEQLTSVPDRRVFIKDVDWAFYEQLVDSIPEGARIRVNYDGKDLEIMSLSPFHDGVKKRLARVVELTAEELEVPFTPLGQTTWKRPEVGRSGFLLVKADDVRRWVVDEDALDGSRWARRLRAWVKAELAPRLPR